MAARRSLGTLTLYIIANLSKLEPGLNKASRALDRNMKNMERSTGRATRSIAAFVSVAAFRSVTQGIQTLSDEYISLNNRLKVATDTQEEFAGAQKLTFAIAQDTRAQLGDTAELYQRLALSTKALSLSQGELADITTTINKALVVSGSTVQGANAAIVQLGQGLAAGALRGQEFNSVAEQAPRLLTALADGLGKTIGGLREMANTGQLTAEVVVKAVRSQRKAIDEEFEKTSVTIGQANTRIRNSLILLVGEQLEASGAANDLVAALDSLRTLLEDPATAEGLGRMASVMVFLSESAIRGAVAVGQLAESIGRSAAQFTTGLALDDEITRQIEAIDRVLKNSYFQTVFFGDTDEISLYTKTTEELKKMRYELEKSQGPARMGDITKPLAELNKQAEELTPKIAAVQAQIEKLQGRTIFPAINTSSIIDKQKIQAELEATLADVNRQIAAIGKADAIVISLDTTELDVELAALEGKLKGVFSIGARSEDAEKLIDKLREQVELFDAAADAVARYNVRMAQGNDDQQQEAASLALINEGQKAGKKAREEAIKATEQARKASSDFVDSVRDQVRVLEMSVAYGDDLTRVTLEYEASLQKLRPAQKQDVENNIARLEILEKIRDEQERQVEVNDNAKGLADKLRSEEEAIRQRYDTEKQIIADATNFTIAEKQRLQEALAAQRDVDLNNTSRAREVEGLLASLLTEEEAIQASYEKRKKIILENTEALGESQGVLLAKLDEDRLRQLAKLDELSQFAIQAAKNMQDAFADFLFDPFSDGLEGLAYNFAQTLQKMAANALAANIFENLLGKEFSSGGAVSGVLGGFLKSFKSYEGGGSTGSGSRVGGVDGKGGFLSVLHPNESVVDHTVSTSAPSAAPSIKNINVLDPAIVGDYLSTSAGEKVIMNVIQRNRSALRF